MNSNDVSDVNAQLAFDKMTAYQKDLAEFQKLGTKEFGWLDIVIIFAPFAILLLAKNIFEIESSLFQLLCLICLVTSSVQTMIAKVTQKTNRRIDLLLKLIESKT